MMYCLTEEEYKDLKARQIPKEHFEAWKKEYDEATAEFSREFTALVRGIPTTFTPPNFRDEVRSLFKRILSIKLPHERT